MGGVVAPFATRAEFVLFHPPDERNADANSAYVDVRDKDGQYLTVIVGVGGLGANEDVDVKLRQASSAGGAGQKDVTKDGVVAAVTRLSGAGDNNSLAAITIDTRILDEPNGFHWVAVFLDLGGGDTVDFFSVGVFHDSDAPPENSGLDSHTVLIGQGY